MKKVIVIVISIVLALSLIGAGVFLYLKNSTHRPFKDLKADDVWRIDVEWTLGLYSYKIHDKETIAEVVSLLNEVEIPYFKEDPQPEFVGAPILVTAWSSNKKYGLFSFEVQPYYEVDPSAPAYKYEQFRPARITYKGGYYITQSHDTIAKLDEIIDYQYHKSKLEVVKNHIPLLLPEQLEELGIEKK